MSYFFEKDKIQNCVLSHQISNLKTDCHLEAIGLSGLYFKSIWVSSRNDQIAFSKFIIYPELLLSSLLCHSYLKLFVQGKLGFELLKLPLRLIKFGREPWSSG